MRLNRFFPWALITTFVVLLLLFCVGVATYRKRSSAEGWQAHTYLLLIETKTLRSDLVESQTNLRGFLLNGDEKFVADYESYNVKFKRSLRTTFDLVDDNREQGIRVERVQTLFATWEKVAQLQIELRRRSGSTPAASKAEQQSRFAQGRIIADRLRLLLDRVDGHERALLEKRIASATNLQAHTEKIVFGGSVLGLLALGVLAALLLANARELERAGLRLGIENSERRRAENEIRIANDSLAAQLERIEQRNYEIELLSECGQMLQACQTMNEACTVVRQMVPQFFPSSYGAVYVLNDSGNFLERIIHWRPLAECEAGNNASNSEREAAALAAEEALPQQLQPDECWALRCGQKHRFKKGAASIACAHLPQPYPTMSLCLPLLAQGNLLGLMNVYDEHSASLEESAGLLALACGEQIGLAISNLQLRETLRHQSIRDPLTNLYNRRYLEESLEHELQRATRSRQSVGVIMMDIDFFKRFNDTYGHGAGDALLQAVASCLQGGTRGGDIACRYGGEELTLILPEATRAQTLARAEELRQAVERTQIRHQGELIGPVTISAGVACFPEDARTVGGLLKTADAALYDAKNAGRNCVVIRQMPEESTPTAAALDGKK